VHGRDWFVHAFVGLPDVINLKYFYNNPSSSILNVSNLTDPTKTRVCHGKTATVEFEDSLPPRDLSLISRLVPSQVSHLTYHPRRSATCRIATFAFSPAASLLLSYSAFEMDLSLYSQSNLLYTQESLSKYQPGGYHPVNLGDTFENDRYKIHHKLGWGGYSTVWLAKDRESVCPAPTFLISS
jgi:hypothetical protein